MKIQIDNIILTPDEPESNIKTFIFDNYNLRITQYVILKKSLDARKKNNIHYKYRITTDIPEENFKILVKHKNITEYSQGFEEPRIIQVTKKNSNKIVIVGCGPSGLFSALRLISAGYKVTLFERGKKIEERIHDIQILEKSGILNLESNVLFGEGGAGTYSDGKLTTRTNRSEIFWFYEKLIQFGAPESIKFEIRPHLGTDHLRSIIKNIRYEILSSGSEIFFNEKVDDILISDSKIFGLRTSSGNEYAADIIIQATGHSARDMYELIDKKNILIEKKNFAIGMRIEHPAELINTIQYGNSRYKNNLPVADYFLTFNNKKTGRGVYTFCMCPGGFVINSSSENNRLCTNGMSFSKRNSEFSNSAIIVTVEKNDTPAGNLGGINFQQMLEETAFAAGEGQYQAPAQRVTSFLNNKIDSILPEVSYTNGVIPCRMDTLLPSWISDEIKNALLIFNNKMKGFTSENGILIGIETRSSSPVRILRNDDFESVTIKGLYPVGEGSGYAGGIVSSAVDGIRAADKIILKFSN